MASIVKLSKLKELLNIVDDDEQYDDALFTWAELASSIVAQQTRMDFSYSARVEDIDSKDNADYRLALREIGDSGDPASADGLNIRAASFRLRGYPVSAITSVKYDPLNKFDGDAIDPSNYVLEQPSGRLIVYVPMEAYQSALRVSYTSGYPVDYNRATRVYQESLEDTADVSTTMTLGGGETAVFGENRDLDSDNAAYISTSLGNAQIVFEDEQAIYSATWVAPRDARIHDIDGSTLTLVGSKLGDFTDSVTIKTRTLSSIAEGQVVVLEAPASTESYKGFRVVASKVGASITRAASVEFRMKDNRRAYLTGAPPELVMAATILAKVLYQKNRSSGFGLVQDPDKTKNMFNYSGVMPPEVVQLLGPFRRLLTGR